MTQLMAATLIAAAGVFVGMAIKADAGDEGSSRQQSITRPDELPADPRAEPPTGDTAPGTPVTAASASTEEPVVAVAKAVTPSVVRISTEYGQGSGIVWDASQGYIVTNHHVIQDFFGGDSETVAVTLVDGTELEGEVVGSSSNQDVAVVRVDPRRSDLVEARFAPTASVQVGQLAVAVGSPFDLTGTVTSGIVSSIRINLQGGSDPSTPVPVEMIQTDAPINPGNSGGALADRQGQVIGMNTSIQTTGAMGNVGVGFAVPSDTIDLIARRIIRGESLDLGYLGISSEVGVHDEDGVLVADVVSGSPADTAGVRIGDVIVALDDEPVNEIAELSAAVKLYRPGDEVRLIVQRDSDLIEVVVVLGSHTSAAPRSESR